MRAGAWSEVANWTISNGGRTVAVVLFASAFRIGELATPPVTPHDRQSFAGPPAQVQLDGVGVYTV